MSGNRGSVWRRAFSDWHDKMQLLLLGIFLYQYVIWFDFYWLTETRMVVEAAFAATLVCGWLVPRLFPVRALLAIAAGIYLTARIVRPEPVTDLPDNSLAPVIWAIESLLRLSPFVWFALGAWALYSLIHWYLQTKWRLFGFMASSIVLFCVIDSFSLFLLWEQVAIMVGCGLLMLVVHHLKQLKVKDPDGYGNLMSYPVPISVMVVTIISASIALGVLAPSIRPVIMDPYTAWKSYRGEAVPAFGSGPGFAGLSTGNASSGYSRNDANLGGAFDFDYTPVFSVDTSRRSYWRGETRSLYNGAGWERTAFNNREALLPFAMSTELPREDVENGLETMEVTQTFRIVEGQSFPVLFAAPYPVRVETISPGGEPVNLSRALWDVDNQSMLWAERESDPYPLTYTVTSLMPIIDEEKLAQAPPVSNPRAFREYLELPDTLPARVAELARDIAVNASNPYDQAQALAEYLSVTYPYTNEPDLTKRQSEDFVDSFLFEIQAGYCDYYSTAMVVMARTLGMPARWVKGYISGESANEFIYEQYLPGEVIDLDGPGTFTVRNSDAHSWAEVYFEGYGWIPFEPTSGFSLPIVHTENETEIVLPEIDPATVVADAPLAEEAGGSRNAAIVAVVSAVAAGVIVYCAVRFQWLTLLRMRGLRKSPNYSLKFLGDMERLLVRFRRKGLAWGEHETLREMMMRWMGQHAWLKKDMEVLLLTFEKAKYSGARLTEEEYNNAEYRIRKLRENL